MFHNDSMTSDDPLQVCVLLFPGFELLDVFGPVELLSQLPQQFQVSYVALASGLVASSQGAKVWAPETIFATQAADVVMVPGGIGTRSLVNDSAFLTAMASWASAANIITSVCTGAAILAAAGMLDGFQATTNKRAYAWATSFGTSVAWQPQARWVHDRNRWTSSGVAAGMDMTAALMAHLVGDEQAHTAAANIELEVHTDPSWDPFAAHFGIVAAD